MMEGAYAEQIPAQATDLHKISISTLCESKTDKGSSSPLFPVPYEAELTLVASLGGSNDMKGISILQHFGGVRHRQQKWRDNMRIYWL